jgi:hypothetical protein
MTTRHRRRSPLFELLLIAACSLAGAAHAQERKAADALFREGRELLARGDVDGACSRFDESQKLEPSGGTLMNLADCHERQGKPASAWSEFTAAEELAKLQGKTARAAEARRRAAALLPLLSHLTILVPHALPGIEVRRDGEPIESGRFGAAIPVDPGPHRVTATAPGYEPASVEVTLGARADSQTVTLPELQPQAAANAEQVPAPAPAAPPAQAPSAAEWTAPPAKAAEPTAADRTQGAGFTGHTAGWVIGGSGIALAGLGGAFYLMSLSANEQAERQCNVEARYQCSSDALEAEERRDTYATLATIGGVAGVAGIGVGAWLLLTAPSSESQTKTSRKRPGPTLIPAIAPHRTTLILRGELP